MHVELIYELLTVLIWKNHLVFIFTALEAGQLICNSGHREC